jgi:hypothetical protein
MSDPESALATLATQLRDEDTPISPHVVAAPAEAPVHGPLAAAGPRAASAPGEYSLVVESVREGYLLHHGAPRLLAGHDDDLALLAGDYLYALGIERLAALGDAPAVRELADLISLCAQLHAEDRAALAEPLWSASALALGHGASTEHEAAKAALRAADPEAPELLQALLDSPPAQDRNDLSG